MFVRVNPSHQDPTTGKYGYAVAVLCVYNEAVFCSAYIVYADDAKDAADKAKSTVRVPHNSWKVFINVWHPSGGSYHEQMRLPT